MWKTLLMLETKGTSCNVFWRKCAESKFYWRNQSQLKLLFKCSIFVAITISG